MSLPSDLVRETPSCGRDFSLETAERELIARALDETGGRRTQAAALLGITRTTLYAKLKRYKIQSPGTPGRPALSAPASAKEKGVSNALP